MSTNLGGAPHEASEFSSRGACAACGFAPEQVGPDDAVVVLQSLPSRWRRALAVHLDDPDPEAVLAGRPSASQWTALEHAGHVRDVLHALDIRLQRVLREDEPVLPETHVTPPAGANEQGMAVVLAALAVSTDQFAQTIARVDDADWSRTGRRRAGEIVTALDLVREAVHEGTHHLGTATATLEALRSSSTAPL